MVIGEKRLQAANVTGRDSELIVECKSQATDQRRSQRHQYCGHSRRRPISRFASKHGHTTSQGRQGSRDTACNAPEQFRQNQCLPNPARCTLRTKMSMSCRGTGEDRHEVWTVLPHVSRLGLPSVLERNTQTTQRVECAEDPARRETHRFAREFLTRHRQPLIPFQRDACPCQEFPKNVCGQACDDGWESSLTIFSSTVEQCWRFCHE